MHKEFGEDRTCSSGDMLADRQTNRQTDVTDVRATSEVTQVQ